MSGFIPVCDPLLDEMRAEFITGGTGGGVEQYVGGYRTAIAGQTISFIPSADIVNVTGTSVTLQPDTAYKILATTGAVNITANPPAANKWGYEGHIELFVAGTGYVVTGTNVVLANALEPDAVNNCTVRFHDGLAIISVEDHVAGYIVTINAASGDGSLAYGLATATNEYISIDASLNGQTLDLAGATTYAGEKHVVGNGYAETVLSGGIVCTSKTTFSNLSMDGVVVSSGTLTMGDVYIPNGATVAVSGGGLEVEKVTGDGGVIDLGAQRIALVSSSTINASGVVFANATSGVISTTETGNTINLNNCIFSENEASGNTGVLVNCYNVNNAYITGCTFTANTVPSANEAGVVAGRYGGVLHLSSCTIADNTVGNAAVYVGYGNSWAEFKECVIEGGIKIQNNTANKTSAVFVNSNRVDRVFESFTSSCTVTLASGAILDLTGNTNATPIAPGGGITFEQGGATVLYSSGAVSGSYMMDNVTLPAGAKLTNTAVVDLNSASVQLTSATTISASGATFANGSATRYSVSSSGTDLGGVIYLYSIGAKAVFSDCTFTGGNAAFGGVCTVRLGSAGGFTREPDAVFSNCIMSGNRATETGGCIAAMNGGYVKLTGCYATNNRVSGGGAPFFANGGYLWFEGFKGNNYTVLRGGSSYLKITSNNKFESDIIGDAGGGIVIIESDAVIDLTGNSNALPVNPLGGVIVADGDSTKSATIINSAGVEVAIVGGTYSKIKNDGTTE